MTIRLYDQHSTSFDFNPGASLPFADIAELAAFDDRQVSDGGLAYTTSVRSLWIKRVVSPVPTTDGITIVATASGDGAWYRSTAPSLSWQSQAAWYIDPAAGDDENDGSTTAAGGSPTYVGALATWAEFYRRSGGVLSVSTTVTIQANITEPLIGSFVGQGSGIILSVLGNPTILITATGTTFTNPVVSGAQAPGTMTAGNIADWTAYNGKMLRSSDSRYAPILGLNGVAPYLPFWATEGLNNAAPAAATTVEVMTLVTAPSCTISVQGLSVHVKLLKFTDTTFTNAPSIYSNVPTLGARFVACEFVSTFNGVSSVYLIGCLLTGSGSIITKAQMNLNGGGSSQRTISHASPGTIAFQGFVMYGGGGLQVGNGSGASAPAAISSSGSGGLGIFATTGAGLTLGSGAFASFNVLYGSGNTGYGLQIGNGARCQVATTPTITGGSGDLQFCAAGTAIPPLTAGAAVPVASALTTWAHFTGAFASKVQNYGNGTTLAGA